MFKLYFDYNGKDIAHTNCYGFSFSPQKRKMYVKIKKDERIITQTYFTKLIKNFMFSF